MTQKEDIQNAVNVMRKGGVILYPTDTVWGIGCDATNAEAVAKVYKIKQRDDSKALICLTDSVDRVQRYVRDVPPVMELPHSILRSTACCKTCVARWHASCRCRATSSSRTSRSNRWPRCTPYLSRSSAISRV